MTITTFEEHDETAAQEQSVPSSPVSVSGQPELIGPIEPFHEMKFEMNARKASLPPTTNISLHDRHMSAGGISNNRITPSSTLPSPSLAKNTTSRGQASTNRFQNDRINTGISSNLFTSTASPSTFSPRRPSLNVDKMASITTSRSPVSILPNPQPEQLSTAQRFQSSLLNNKGSSSGGVPADRLSNREYERDATKNSSPSNINGRRISAMFGPNATASVLPERTRLRRQRRMGSQDSTDQSEDPVERLNKLRARISGALSEVKGVLNKYSTETEPKEDIPQKVQLQIDRKIVRDTDSKEDIPQKVQIHQQTDRQTELKDDISRKTSPPTESPLQEKSSPVEFRFVKKVRRRSVFNEDDEIKCIEGNFSQENREGKGTGLAVVDTEASIRNESDERDLSKQTTKDLEKNIQDKPNQVTSSAKLTQISAKMNETEIEVSHPKTTDPTTTKSADETLKDNKIVVPAKHQNEKRRVSIGTLKGVEDELIPRDLKIQRRPSDSAAIVKKFSNNLTKPETITEKTFKKEVKPARKTNEVQKLENSKFEIIRDIASSAPAESGKRLTVKKSDSLRRSSIAAVEVSKIEPPISNSIKTQRRPSDSGVIIKNTKMTTADISVPQNAAKLNARNSETNIGRSSSDANRESNEKCQLIEKNSRALKSDLENKCKDESVTSIAIADKKSMMMPIQSIEIIDNDASIPPSSSSLSSLSSSSSTAGSTTPLSSSLTTVIGRATKALATAIGTVISPSAKKTTLSNDTNDSKVALKSDGLTTIASVEVPSSSSHINEAGSQQQAPFNLTPTVLKANVISDVSCEKDTEDTATKVVNNCINHISTISNSVTALKSDGEVKATLLSPSSTSPSAASPPPSPSPSPSPSASPLPSPSLFEQASAQQVVATDDNCIHDRVTEIITTTSQKSLSEVNVAASSKIAAIPRVSPTNVVATKANVALVTPDSVTKSIERQASVLAEVSCTEPNSKENNIEVKMPELQVLPTPVKALEIQPKKDKDTEVHAAFCEPKDLLQKKKVVLKKVVRKGRTGAAAAAAASEIHTEFETTTNKTNETDEVDETSETSETLKSREDEINLQLTSETEAEPAPLAPKPRKVKKKVIIKRLQRRLSGSEQSFFINQSFEEKGLPDIETIERAIAYVTDDEADNEEANESNTLIQPHKSCMRLREYQVGDWVMYAERFKKTQIRWKKGRVIERITSISYKVDVDGKEVSAHINYLKKYTGRKVRFGDKEYLEIDYEQIEAVEEVKTRTYSIWNMV